MSKNFLLNAYVFTSLTIVAVGLSVMGFWLFYPYKPFTFYEDHAPTLKQVYRPGEIVQWRTHFKHNTTGKLVQVDRQLVDGIVINYPSVNYLSDGEEQDFINASMRLPDFISPGTYQVVIINTVKVNPLRDIIVVRKTNEFTVEPLP